MIDNRIIEYLEEAEEFKLLPPYQKKFKDVLLKAGINPDSALFDLMTTYAGEFNGLDGFIINVADDLDDYENSVTKQLIESDGIDNKYISLYNFEFDDYLLYNKEDDSVVYVEGSNTDKLSDGNFDEKWSSFNDFLLYFFEI